MVAELVETIERRAQAVWIPVTVATLVPGRDEIISRCRTKAVSGPVEIEPDDCVRVFLDQTSDTLRRGLLTSPDIGTATSFTC